MTVFFFIALKSMKARSIWNYMYIEMSETIQHFLEMFKNIVLQGLLGLILGDIFTGIFKALKFKRMNSSFGIQGLGKHLLYFFILIFGTYILKVTQLSGFLYVIYAIYFIFYATSICENCYELGWYIPKFILKRLLIYKEAIDEGNISFVYEAIKKVQKGDISTKDIEVKTNLSSEESETLRKLLEKAEIKEGD